MVLYCYIMLGLYWLGLIVSLANGKAALGLQQLVATALWLPVAGRVVGWW